MSRALVIGAETAGLTGVDNDARDVAAWLMGCGFDVDLRIGGAATRDSILDGLRALAVDVCEDTAAVVYYGGHGGVLEVQDAQRSRLGYLVPTDHEVGGRFRSITELEWSASIAALTARTRNVAVIHDCCHAAQTVRGAPPRLGRVRALRPVPVSADDVRAIVRAVGGDGGIAHPLGNPDAVRLTASGARGLAWERAGAGGRVQGVFTSSLIAEVSALEGGPGTVSWAEIGGRVRERVLRATGRQRPEIEGPARRRMFGVDVIDVPAKISVRPHGRRFVMAAGRVHGVERGDVFRSVSSARQAVVVTQVGPFESIVRAARERGVAGGFEVVAAAGAAAARRAFQRAAEELEEPGQLSMAVERVEPAPSWLDDGAELDCSDRVCVHLTNHMGRNLWLHLFIAGPGPALEALGPVSSGTEIEPRSTEILGAVPGLGTVGFSLRWPADAPEEGARQIELIAIATTAPVDLASVVDPGPDLDDGLEVSPGAGPAAGRMPLSEASRDVSREPIEHFAVSARRRLVLRP